MVDASSIVVGPPPPEQRRALMDELLEFNRKATGIADDEEFYAFTRNDRGDLVAGIYGWLWGGTCEIALFWVREDQRGRGLGGALLGAAEDKARELGCRQVVLRTHSFQAPEFYAARGYRSVGIVDDYPEGYSDFILRKTL